MNTGGEVRKLLNVSIEDSEVSRECMLGEIIVYLLY